MFKNVSLIIGRVSDDYLIQLLTHRLNHKIGITILEVNIKSNLKEINVKKANLLKMVLNS